MGSPRRQHGWLVPAARFGSPSFQRAWPILLCGLLLFTGGCPRATITTQTPHPTIHATEDIALNSQQVRVLVRASVLPLSGIIVQAADQIIAGTADPAVQRRALVWKIEAVPALRESLFLANGLRAVFDAWVLSWQMTNYFESGPGKNAFGDQQGVALAACQNLEKELEQLVTSMTTSGDVSNARAVAQKFASDHPIQTSIASRESILTQPGLQAPISFSLAEVAGDLTVTLDDLSRRIAIYSAQVVDQSRWEAQLLVMDMASDYKLDKALPLAQRAVESAGSAVQTFNRLGPPLERSLAVVEKAPDLIDREREATLKGVASIVDVQVSALIDRQREAAIKEVSAEMRDILNEQRKAVAQDIEQASVRVVDHAFYRAILLVIIASVVVLVAALLYQLLRKRPDPQ